jgi:hypothetical protein
MFKNVKIEATTKTGTQPKLVHHPMFKSEQNAILTVIL